MRIATVLVVGTFAASAGADDVAEVNGAADRLLAAYNENSAEAMVLFAADGILLFTDPVPVLNEGKEPIKQFFAGFFEQTERAQVISVGPRTTRVTGTTAVIAQNRVFVWKPIDGAAESMFVNSMQTWSKIGDEWLITGWMVNSLPHGTAP